MSGITKVSIMIPTYNQEEFICRAIESALVQDYPNLEVIVSDDNSTDNTPNVIRKFLKDRRLKYYRNERNLGRVKNYRETLYKRVTGNWVLNLDGDDYLYDNKVISSFVNIISKYKKENLVAIIGSRIIKYPSGKEVICKTNKRFLGLRAGKEIFLNWDKVNFGHSDTLYNVKVARKIDFYRFDCLSSDSESILRLLLHGNVFIIDKIVSVWNIHDSNTSLSSEISKYIENIECIKHVKDYAERLCFDKKTLSDWERRIMPIYLRMLFVNLAKNERFFSIKKIKALNLLRKYNIKTKSQLMLAALLFTPINENIDYIFRKIFWKMKRWF